MLASDVGLRAASQRFYVDGQRSFTRRVAYSGGGNDGYDEYDEYDEWGA
jgi:hypothetical protein